MKKTFLCVWTDEDSTMHAQICNTPTPVLARRHGRAGVLLPAASDGRPADLASHPVVVFLVPKSSAALLAVVMNDLGADVAASTFLSYGHASVVLLLDDEESWHQIRPQIEEHLRGVEVWRVDPADGRVTRRDLCRPTDAVTQPTPGDISDNGVNFEAAAQLRQFNANIAVLARTVRHYAPQMWPLVANLHARVAEIAHQLRELDSADDDISERQTVVFQSVLVETNAVVTLFCSQLGSGTLPIGSGRFPVGEYSLLGIGVPLAAAWQIYHHLSNVFSQFDYAGLLARDLPRLNPFEWNGPASSTKSYAAWAETKRRLEAVPPEPADTARLHVPYFSSRWGFHESLHSISLAWQCISASASKEWNLLTLTHEFLHAQVRVIVAKLFNPDDDVDLAATLAQRYNAKEIGDSALHSLQMAYVDTLLLARNVVGASKHTHGTEDVQAKIPKTISPEYLMATYRHSSELVQEVIVHVLDYRYTYASRPEDYVDAIWSSWALVPSVADRIEYYVLRTLCALSVDVDGEGQFARFEKIRSQLLEVLHRLNGRAIRRPAIKAAIALLESEDACKGLALQFGALQQAAQIAKHFFVAKDINVALLSDTHATTDGRRSTYELRPGKYMGISPESPVGFLLDRFPDYTDSAGEGPTEHVGLWQMLQLT